MGSKCAFQEDLENLLFQILELEDYVNQVSGSWSVQRSVEDLQFQVEEAWRVLETFGDDYAFRSDLDATQSDLNHIFIELDALQLEAEFIRSHLSPP